MDKKHVNSPNELSQKQANLANADSKPSSQAVIDNLFSGLLEDIRADTLQKAKPKSTLQEQPTTTYDDEIKKEKARKEKIANDKLQTQNEKLKTENDNLRSDQELKSTTLRLLFALLSAETLVIFILTFMQGFHLWHFNLDLLTLRIVIVASLLQISAMLTIAVRHLFPSKNN